MFYCTNSINMADQKNLVTTCTFKGREFVVKMNSPNGNTLEVSATDKFTAEEWSCCFDAAYIENQTRKTGNFKHFEVFVTMLKTGLLKSSECVSVDLLNFEDLELLRSRRYIGRSFENTSRSTSSHDILPNANRRYLILTYIVEFDRVHYPLTLEYCGPPDPQVLQSIIRRLEAEVAKLREQLTSESRNSASNDKIKFLEHKVQQLTAENLKLKNDVQLINRDKIKSTDRRVKDLEKQLQEIEESQTYERNVHEQLVKKLRDEKMSLIRRLKSLEVMSSRKSESEVKRSATNIAPEQARLEEMRMSLRKYSHKMNSNDKLPSKCRSDDSLVAAAFFPSGARSRSCSASSKCSSVRSQARACCSSVVDNSACPDVKPRGRSRTRRANTNRSAASGSFKSTHSRTGSASSRSSTHSVHSARSITRTGSIVGTTGEKRAHQKCRNANMKTVNDLELRIKKLQKRLEESKPA